MPRPVIVHAGRPHDRATPDPARRQGRGRAKGLTIR